jgi:hypothetical protein
MMKTLPVYFHIHFKKDKGACPKEGASRIFISAEIE